MTLNPALPIVATFEFLSLDKLLLSFAFNYPTWKELDGESDFSSAFKLRFEFPIVTLTGFLR